MGETIKLPTAAEALGHAVQCAHTGDTRLAQVWAQIARELREGTAAKAVTPETRELVETERTRAADGLLAALRGRVDELLTEKKATMTELGELRAKLRSRERSDDVRRNEGSTISSIRDDETKVWSGVAEPGERFSAPNQTARMPRDFFALDNGASLPAERPQIAVPLQRPLPADMVATIKEQLAQPVPFSPQLDTAERGKCAHCDQDIYTATVHQGHAVLKSWRHRATGLVICTMHDDDDLGHTQYATPAS